MLSHVVLTNMTTHSFEFIDLSILDLILSYQQLDCKLDVATSFQSPNL